MKKIVLWVVVAYVVISFLVLPGYQVVRARWNTSHHPCGDDIGYLQARMIKDNVLKSTAQASTNSAADRYSVAAVAGDVATWAAGQHPHVAAVATFNAAYGQNSALLAVIELGQNVPPPTVYARQTAFAVSKSNVAAACAIPTSIN